MKIKCKYCGRRNSPDEDLCLSCGAVLPEPELQFQTERDDPYWESLSYMSGSFHHLQTVGMSKKLEFPDLDDDYWGLKKHAEDW